MSSRPKRKAATAAESTIGALDEGSPRKRAKKNPEDEEEAEKDAENGEAEQEEKTPKKGRPKSSEKRKGKQKQVVENEGEEGEGGTTTAVPAPPTAATGDPCPQLTEDDSKYVKIVSWNLNGLNAIMKRGDLLRYIQLEKPDIVCLQETKATAEKTVPNLLGPDYPHQYWSCCSVKKGYAGTALFSKIKPINVTYGIGKPEHDQEGRTIIAEFEKFFLVNTYVPNSGIKLDRLAYRQTWNADLLAKFKEMDKIKPIVWTGDLNVAHEEIDLAKPKGNHKTAGFTKEERHDFGVLLSSGFVDTFRRLHPGVQQFTFWTNKQNAREKNIGWRLDYFVVSERMFPDVAASFVRPLVYGSDHCPLGILLPRDRGYAA